MKIIVGLGNPGPKYETTRHNAGFLAVDRLVDRWRAQGPSEKFQADVYQADVEGEKVLLVKPHTYMNLSGRAVAPLANFYKVPASDIIAIYDELDLKPMALRIKTGGGSGGHNGIKSLDECLGSGQNNYHRVRIGIGKPATVGLRMNTADYVLAPFSNDELIQLDLLLDRVAEAVELIVAGDIRRAMTNFNKDPVEKTAEKEK